MIKVLFKVCWNKAQIPINFGEYQNNKQLTIMLIQSDSMN